MTVAPSPPLVDGYALARFLGIAPVTIRQWAVRGAIARAGRDRHGRTLYDADQVLRHAQNVGLRPTA